MPSPKSSLATLRPDLGMAMLEIDLAANEAKMVALRVAPVLEANEKAGNWGKVNIEELLSSAPDARASGQRYNQVDFAAPDPDAYNCTDHGLEGAVDDDENAEFGNYFDSEVLVATRNRNIVLTNMEVEVQTLAAATSYAANVSTWTNQSAGTPIKDVTTEKNNFLLQAGVMPNTLVIVETDFNSMRNTAEIIDRVKFSGLQDPNVRNINAQAIAQALDIENVVIAGALRNTKNPGLSTSSGSPTIGMIWPAGVAYLMYVNAAPDPQVPSWARTIHWGMDGSSIGFAAESYRDESRRSNMIRCRMNRALKQRYARAIRKLTFT